MKKQTSSLRERNSQLAEFLLNEMWMSKIACLADMFCHLNKLNTGDLQKYLCTEKQNIGIQNEAGSLPLLCAEGRYRDVFDFKRFFDKC